LAGEFFSFKTGIPGGLGYDCCSWCYMVAWYVGTLTPCSAWIRTVPRTD